MENNHDFERIDQYLNNELSETEKMAFDDKLKSDAVLMEEFEKRELTHKVLDYMIARDLKAQLEQMESSGKVISIRHHVRTRIYALAAAASVLLVVSFFFMQGLFSGSDNVSIAGNAYELPDYNIRSGESSFMLPELLENGVKAFENQEFGSAIELLNQIKPEDKFYIQAQYYLGHCYYAQKTYDLSYNAFEKVVSSNDIRLLEDAQWYSLLSCIAQNKSCSTELEGILENKNHLHHQDAITLKMKLK